MRHDYQHDMSETEAQKKRSPRALQLHKELTELAARDVGQSSQASRWSLFLYQLIQSKKELHPEDDLAIRSLFFGLPKPASPFCVGTPEQRDLCSRTGCPRDPVCGN
jgi:hypothetical protein